LPPIFKRERARSRISRVTIVIAKPNENEVEKALEWPPGSQCLTPGVGMRNADFFLHPGKYPILACNRNRVVEQTGL